MTKFLKTAPRFFTIVRNFNQSARGVRYINEVSIPQPLVKIIEYHSKKILESPKVIFPQSLKIMTEISDELTHELLKGVKSGNVDSDRLYQAIEQYKNKEIDVISGCFSNLKQGSEIVNNCLSIIDKKVEICAGSQLNKTLTFDFFPKILLTNFIAKDGILVEALSINSDEKFLQPHTDLIPVVGSEDKTIPQTLALLCVYGNGAETYWISAKELWNELSSSARDILSEKKFYYCKHEEEERNLTDILKSAIEEGRDERFAVFTEKPDGNFEIKADFVRLRRLKFFDENDNLQFRKHQSDLALQEMFDKSIELLGYKKALKENEFVIFDNIGSMHGRIPPTTSSEIMGRKVMGLAFKDGFKDRDI